jgi:hypothetical protein
MNAIILKGAALRQPPLPQSGPRAKTIAHPWLRWKHVAPEERCNAAGSSGHKTKQRVISTAMTSLSCLWPVAPVWPLSYLEACEAVGQASFSGIMSSSYFWKVIFGVLKPARVTIQPTVSRPLWLGVNNRVFCYCQTAARLLTWAPSLTKELVGVYHLQSIVSAGLRQHSHSLVRVRRNWWQCFTASDSKNLEYQARYSTPFFVRVPPNVISLKLCTLKVTGV